MGAVRFYIDGQEVTGLTAELHFMEWVLSLAQERDKELGQACKGDRSALNAVCIFQKGAYRYDAPSRILIGRSGVRMGSDAQVAV